MHDARARRPPIAPWDRPVQGLVDPEHPFSVPEPLEAPPVPGREPVAGDLADLGGPDGMLEPEIWKLVSW